MDFNKALDKEETIELMKYLGFKEYENNDSGIRFKSEFIKDFYMSGFGTSASVIIETVIWEYQMLFKDTDAWERYVRERDAKNEKKAAARRKKVNNRLYKAERKLYEVLKEKFEG